MSNTSEIVNNIYKKIPGKIPDELINVLLCKNNVRIERIVSKGHSSPDGFWYDQDKTEFVILLKGKAKLVFEDKKETVVLGAGDYIEIAAHARHRIEWTDPEKNTVWLAIYC